MGAFLCQHEALKYNSPKLFLCCSIYSLQHYAHHRKTHCCTFCQLRKLFFRWFYMKEHHWLCTIEIIPPFAKNGTSYSAVAVYKVKRWHCYCTPCSVCKREKFDQFNISLNYVYKYPVPAWLNDFILGSMRNVKNVMKCICAAYVDSRKKHFEPPHDKPNKMISVPSEDSSAWASAQSHQSLRCALNG